VQPLTPAEERTWRTLMRLMMLMPRAIDEDLCRRTGLGLTRYVVLMRLSEAPDRTLRMSEGLVTRQMAPSDGRASLATLTEKGLHRLQDAWPAHLAGARRLVMDHLDPRDLADFNRMTERLLRGIEGSSGFQAGQSCEAEKATPN